MLHVRNVYRLVRETLASASGGACVDGSDTSQLPSIVYSLAGMRLSFRCIQQHTSRAASHIIHAYLPLPRELSIRGAGDSVEQYKLHQHQDHLAEPGSQNRTALCQSG